MSNTPNYGWDTPDNTGLVRNGALDMRTLGNAIDTSVWNVGFGQAGKNKIINGDFRINQRNFTSITASSTFGFDRWWLRTGGTGGTSTWTPQVFTPGTAPVAGYEGTNYSRVVTSGFSSTDAIVGLRQQIEDVRTFAGQTVTISFWAKAATGTPNIGIQIAQNFGSGGSTLVNYNAGLSAITTAWQRYSFTYSLPSISGKTVGTSSFLMLSIYCAVGTGISGYGVDIPAVGTQNNTFDIWGVQVEAGNRATPFQTASGGSIQGELAMCQRYYRRNVADYNNAGQAESGTIIDFYLLHPVTMRDGSAILDQLNMGVYQTGVGSFSGGTWSIFRNSIDYIVLRYTHTSSVFTTARTAQLNPTTGTAYWGVSKEL